MANVAESTVAVESQKEAPKKGSKSYRSRGLNLPPTPNGSLTNSPEKLFEYGRSLSADQWTRMSGYLYRLIPAIRRKPSYIDKFQKPIDEDYILKHALGGSGRYQIRLNDKDGDGTIIQCFLDLNDPDYPPRYNIHELDLKSDDNKQLIEELKQEGKLNQNGDVIEQKVADNPEVASANALRDIALKAMETRQEKPGLESQAFSKMMDMMSSASAKSIDIALAQLKGNEKAAADPMMTLVMQFMMKQLELAEKRAEPAKSNGVDPMMTLMLKQIELAEKRAELAEARAIEERKTAEAERQRQHEKDMELLKQRATAADPMDMVEKVLNLKERLGGEEPDARNWKEKLVDQGFEALPSILTAFQGYVARRPGVQPQPQQPRPMQPQPQPQPQPVQTVPTPGVDTTVQPQPIADPEIAFLLPLFEAQGRQLVRAFSSDPASGPDVARMVSLLAGAAVYERIARMGREKILLAIAMLPEMQADLLKAGTPAMLSDFIDDFIAGPEDPDEDGDDDDDGEDDPTDPDEFPKMGTPKRKPKRVFVTDAGMTVEVKP